MHCPLPNFFNVLTPESSVDDLDGNSDELPTLGTDIRLLTARTNVIIVCHVDIKDKLFPSSLEVGLLYSVLHARLRESEEEREEREREGERRER